MLYLSSIQGKSISGHSPKTLVSLDQHNTVKSFLQKISLFVFLENWPPFSVFCLCLKSPFLSLGLENTFSPLDYAYLKSI